MNSRETRDRCQRPNWRLRLLITGACALGATIAATSPILFGKLPVSPENHADTTVQSISAVRSEVRQNGQTASLKPITTLNPDPRVEKIQDVAMNHVQPDILKAIIHRNVLEDNQLTAPIEPASRPKPIDSAEETIFLTIVGNETFISRGSARSRPPGISDLHALTAVNDVSAPSLPTTASPSTATVNAPDTGQRPGYPQSDAASYNPQIANNDTTLPSDSSNTSGDISDEYIPIQNINETREIVDNRPWPTPSCPWTLSPGSDATTANLMQLQYGCRYTSTCRIDDKSCTYYYLGS